MPSKNIIPAMTDAELDQLLLSEWMGVLRKLFIAYDKKPTPELIDAYRDALDDVPLGLFEVIVQRVIENNKFFPKISELRGIIRDELSRSGVPDISAWLERRNRYSSDGKLTIIGEVA